MYEVESVSMEETAAMSGLLENMWGQTLNIPLEKNLFIGMKQTIPHQMMPFVGSVNANLVSSTCLRVGFEQHVLRLLLEHPEVGF